MSDNTPDLDGAYALETPDDHRRLYASWASTYDQDFSETNDYRLPFLVGNIFADSGGAGPVLDVGAGTGLVAEILKSRNVSPIDGMDISPEMLAIAETKGIYEKTIEADLLSGLQIPDGTYAGVVSAGTFTLGHLGPEVLPELLRICAPGAVFCLSINAEHFRTAGFQDAFQKLSSQVTNLALPEHRIYGSRNQTDHAEDLAYVATFQKA